MNKKTVIVGASENQSRYAYKAAVMLDEYGVDFVPVGIRPGAVLGRPICALADRPTIEHVHTITLYINPKNQREWYDYFFQLHPKRVIFNPGTENAELEEALEEQGIDVVQGCTLVMLRSHQF